MKNFGSILFILATASSLVGGIPLTANSDVRVRSPIVEPADITARSFAPRAKAQVRDSGNSTENAARSLGRRNGNSTEEADAENAARSLPLYSRQSNSTSGSQSNEKRSPLFPRLRRDAGSSGCANETA
ncbi:hypothetical protein F4779DRAFT_248227 [Xylariaceae sp. FL0662B]|nr:hypothetical protein F4779DRAFT_248227 [Xylariaceae sp. FL0662B]